MQRGVGRDVPRSAARAPAPRSSTCAARDRRRQPLDRRRPVSRPAAAIRLDGGRRVRNLPGADPARRTAQRMREARRRPAGGSLRHPPEQQVGLRSNSCSTSRSRSRSPCVMRARCARSIAVSAGASGGASGRGVSTLLQVQRRFATRRLRAASCAIVSPPGGSSSPFASAKSWHTRDGRTQRVNGAQAARQLADRSTSAARGPAVRHPQPADQPSLTVASASPGQRPIVQQFQRTSQGRQNCVRAPRFGPTTGRNMAEKSSRCACGSASASGSAAPGTRLHQAAARRLTMIKKTLPFGFHRLAKPIG